MVMAGAPGGVGTGRTEVSPAPRSRRHAAASSTGVPPWAIVLSRVRASLTGLPPNFPWPAISHPPGRSAVESLPPASDPAADLVAAGTLGFRPFGLNHPALFQIGIQQTSVPPDVAQTIASAAERALPALHRRIARLRDAGRLGDRTIPEAAWEFHATCEGLAALELRCALRPEDGQRLWHDTLSALVAGWRHVTPGATPTGSAPNTRRAAHSGSQPHQDPFRSGHARNDLRLEY